MGVEAQGVLVTGHGFGELALAVTGRPQQLPHLGVTVLGLEDLPVELFRLAEVPGLMKLAGFVKGFCDGGHHLDPSSRDNFVLQGGSNANNESRSSLPTASVRGKGGNRWPLSRAQDKAG